MSSTTDKITEQEQQDFNPQNNPQDPQQLLLQTHLHHLQMQTPSPSITDPFSLCNFTSAPRAGLVFSDVPPSPWSNIPPVQPFNPDPVQYSPYPSTSAYGGWFGRRPTGALQWAYDGSGLDQVRILSEAIGPVGLQAELMKMTAQEIMDAKALAASKSHSEAERRRRERINNHLAKLRSLLPSTTKTDKASLLAEVIQHVKELKRQTSIIAETSPVPTETDELTIDPAGESSSDPTGRFVFKASICCDDRSDLLPDLIKALKALRLKTLKAEITTLGGRVKNVLFITGDEIDPSEPESSPEYSISSIEEALRGVMEKSGGDDSASGNVKRQRTNTAVSTGNVQYS